jgi:hypothetical protein
VGESAKKRKFVELYFTAPRLSLGIMPVESLTQVPETESTFYRLAQRNAFPSPRCASAIQIVLPSESMAETQPQLQPAWLSLSAMISQYFTAADSAFR